MDQAGLVTDLETRAAAAGLSMAEVCRRAGVATSTPSRWKAGTVGLTLTTLNKLRSVLEAIDTAPEAAASCDKTGDRIAQVAA